MNNLEQHFLNDLGRKRINHIFSQIDTLENKNILELGSGTGALTKEILFFNPKSIIAVELDSSLFNIASNDKISFLIQDIKSLDFSLYKDFICVSAPPYSLLKDIHPFLNRMNFVLVVSEKYFHYFSNFKIIGEIEEHMFFPISTKKHFVITNIKLRGKYYEKINY